VFDSKDGKKIGGGETASINPRGAKGLRLSENMEKAAETTGPLWRKGDHKKYNAAGS